MYPILTHTKKERERETDSCMEEGVAAIISKNMVSK